VAEEMPPAAARRRTLLMMGWVVAFFADIWLLGFCVAVPVMTLVHLTLGARERWVSSVLLAALAYALFFGLFDYGLHIRFPTGVASAAHAVQDRFERPRKVARPLEPKTAAESPGGLPGERGTHPWGCIRGDPVGQLFRPEPDS
jgi:hypothetical protein